MTPEDLKYMNQSKLAMANFLLPQCPYLLVDATQPGVDVPTAIKRDELVLRIGRNPSFMGMPDLTLDEWGWGATIIIQGLRHYAKVPWRAVSRMWGSEGPLVLWPVVGGAPVQEPAPAPEPEPEAPQEEPRFNVYQLKRPRGK